MKKILILLLLTTFPAIALAVDNYAAPVSSTQGTEVTQTDNVKIDPVAKQPEEPQPVKVQLQTEQDKIRPQQQELEKSNKQPDEFRFRAKQTAPTQEERDSRIDGRNYILWNQFIQKNPLFANPESRHRKFANYLYKEKYSSMIINGKIAYADALNKIADETYSIIGKDVQ